jgi:HK97 family phage prohead protease
MPTAPTNNLDERRNIGEALRKFAVSDVEVRAKDDGSSLVDFYGHASVTKVPFEMYGGPDKGGWNEIVDAGAFAKTLDDNADVVFKVNHEGYALARTKNGSLSLAEDKVGLEVKAELDTRISVVNDITLLMQSGVLDEMSMAFRVIRQKWLDAEGEEVPWWDLAGIERHLVEVSLNKGDVSVVNYGANPFTDAGLRSLDDSTLRSVHEQTGALLAARGVPGAASAAVIDVASTPVIVPPSYYADLASMHDRRQPVI